MSGSRTFAMVPVSMPDGRLFHLASGKYNAMQAAIIEQFAPRFVPGAVVLHLGDANNKALASARPVMKELGIPLTGHEKLPSVVLWNQKKNWLFLIEATPDHRLISPKRLHELTAMLKKCSVELVFVSVFSNRAEFADNCDDIPWHTHVWLADAPDHMIHFNGEKFQGPVQR